MNPRPRRLKLLRWLPRSLLITHGPAADGSVYLTFDDGPHPEFTGPLLDLLAAHDAKATFFLVGDQIERSRALVERMVAEGHQIGNHSFSHPRFGRLTMAERMAEIDRVERLLTGFDGRETHLFRPPRGELQLMSLLHFLRHGRKVAIWSYDSLDYLQPSPEELVRLMRDDSPRAGDIVLMHDDSGLPSEVLRQLLPEWRAAGLNFPALPSGTPVRKR